MSRALNEAEQNGCSAREMCEDFGARWGELAVTFGYEYVKSRCELYKKSDIFARFLVSKVFLRTLLLKYRNLHPQAYRIRA